MAIDNSDPPTYVILAQDEPDLEKMQKKIMEMLQNGKSVNDIAISLRLDPETIQGFAERFNRTRWQNMSRQEMRNEHLLMLNEMAEVGKLQYMSDPKPPHAFAVASLVKTAGEVFRDLDAADAFGDVRDRMQLDVIQTPLEVLVQKMLQHIGTTRKALVDKLPGEARAEAARQLDDVARALAVVSKEAFDEATKRMDSVFEDTAQKSKKTTKKSSTDLVQVVPNADR